MTVQDVLRLDKAQYVAAGLTDEECVLLQTGACFVDGFELPASAAIAAARGLDEAIIETFMVSTNRTGEITALGTDEELAHHWKPSVERLTEAVLAWLRAENITVAETAFVSASITRADQVNDEPHFDDGLFDPLAGVGFVAVMGDGAGPKVATSPLPCSVLAANTLLEVTESEKASLHSGAIQHQEADANQIAAFPQFAQLHCGPGPIDGAELRNLMVFRVETVPQK